LAGKGRLSVGRCSKTAVEDSKEGTGYNRRGQVGVSVPEFAKIAIYL